MGLAGGTGKLVARLVAEMAQTNSGAGHQGSEKEDHDDISSVRKRAKRIGLKEISAFVPDRRGPRSTAAQNKAEQREKNKRKQCNVEVTEDVRSTIQALAQAIKADPTVHTLVRSLVFDAETKQTIQAVVAAIGADSGMYVRMPAVIQLCKILCEQGEEVTGIVDMARRGELTRTLTAFAANPTLFENVLKWKASGDDILSTFGSVFDRTEDGVADAKVILAAVVAASQRPDDVLRFVSASQGGGLRGRLLKWLLGSQAKSRP